MEHDVDDARGKVRPTGFVAFERDIQRAFEIHDHNLFAFRSSFDLLPPFSTGKRGIQNEKVSFAGGIGNALQQLAIDGAPQVVGTYQLNCAELGKPMR